MAMGPRKVIARRAAMELTSGDIVNLGIGMPEGVSDVVNEQGLLEQIVMTAEPAVIGGIPAGGLSFGAAANNDAIIDQPTSSIFMTGVALILDFSAWPRPICREM